MYIPDEIGKLAAVLIDAGGQRERSWDVANKVVKMYDDPARYYHNLTHIIQCFSMLAPDKKYSTFLSRDDKRAINLALWFHDAVYDYTRHDNEEMSASLLLDCVGRCGIDSAVVEVARGAILATKHQIIPDNLVDKWVVDIDLSILSSPREEFDTYEKNVRKEFSHIDDLNWVTGRTNFLNKMLEREWIYSTSDFRRLYEGDARENIKRSIARLDKGEVSV
jgi:predicted metal-dependent HD superfamily phosphohydrolase